MPPPTITSLPTAATYINIIRDMVPDAVYSADGTASPQSDGDLFRAQSIVRFLNDAVYVTAQRIGWQVRDWYAFQMATYQQNYPVDARWINVEEAFANQWQLTRINEGYTIFQTVPSQKPLWWNVHSRTNQINVGFYPVPNLTDPTTTLTATITSGTTTNALVTATASFYSYGFVQIDSEILQYGTLNSGAVGTLIRGACGTTAAQHVTGASVYHLGLWVKGPRLPIQITTSTDIVELPIAYQYALSLYTCARLARSQNDDQQAKSYMDEYNSEMQRILNDPLTKQHQGARILGYGEAPLGALAWGRVIVPMLVIWLCL
jgi:hypothetical protein